MENKKKYRFLVLLLIALIIHAFLVPASIYLFLLSTKPDGTRAGKFFQVSLVDHSVNKKQKIYEYNPPEKMPDGQVVNSPKAGIKNKLDPDTKFLSDRNQFVQKQTRSTIQLPRKALQSPNLLPLKNQNSQSNEKIKTVAGLNLPSITELQSDRNKGDAPETTEPEKHGENKQPIIQLFPSYSQIAKTLAGNGLDLLEDVAEGENVMLSTRMWKFSSFFERVKELIEQYWHPDIAFAINDPTGRIYGYRDRETILRVVLNANGSVRDIFVIQPSGADFLDDEAFNAIKNGSPFPNPPPDLIDPNYNIIVFNCGFLVEVGSPPIIHIKRYR